MVFRTLLGTPSLRHCFVVFAVLESFLGAHPNGGNCPYMLPLLGCGPSVVLAPRGRCPSCIRLVVGRPCV